MHRAGAGVDQTGAGIYPYAPATALWSDNTIKERFLALPGFSTMGLTAKGNFAFPSGTVLVKNFSLPLDERDPAGTARRIETRVMVRHGAQWEGYSYAWDAAGLDATLVPAAGLDRQFQVRDAAGIPRDFQWHYPSRTECFSCHTVAAERVLGLTPEAINTTLQYPASGRTANQLETFQSIGLLHDTLPATVPAMARFDDPHESLQNRARAYLAMNCAMCHQPGGPTPARMDFRWTTPNASMAAINATGYFAIPGVTGTRVIRPGDPDRSAVAWRMAHRGVGQQMPPLGTARVDEEAVAVIRAWIESLAP